MKREATYVGGWVARPDCDLLHVADGEDLESVGGYRNRGYGYDHEHYEFIPSTFGKDGANPSLTVVDEVSELPWRISDDLGAYSAVLSISTDSGAYASLDVSVRGSARVVSRMLEAAADIFKEEAER